MSKEWASAFAAAQENFPHVGKDSKAKIETQKGNYEYSYASLDSILTAVLPVLNANGLGLSQSPIFEDGRVGVETRIYHISGHVETFGPLFLPAGNNAQSAGSAITYARRYSLCAALGISPEEDDDGAKAVIVKEEPRQDPADWLATQVQILSSWSVEERREAYKTAVKMLAIPDAEIHTMKAMVDIFEHMKGAYLEAYDDPERPF